MPLIICFLLSGFIASYSLAGIEYYGASSTEAMLEPD
jgi:hypothetical protein